MDKLVFELWVLVVVSGVCWFLTTVWSKWVPEGLRRLAFRAFAVTSLAALFASQFDEVFTIVYVLAGLATLTVVPFLLARLF